MARPPQPHKAVDNRPEATSSPILRGVWMALIAVAIVPPAVHALLVAFNVPLGKPGTITYPYSDFFSIRITRVPQMIAIAAVLASAVMLAADPRRGRRVYGVMLAFIGICGVAAWTMLSPPAWQRQLLFNMLSPSHDGAFFLEADFVERASVSAYLTNYAARAATPPAEMKGTRVISNPPGATLLALSINNALASRPGVERWFGDLAVDDPTVPMEFQRRAGHALAFSLALSGLWILGAGLLFIAARAFVSTESALAMAILAAVSPMTVLFAPGKDPAQFATVGAFLCFWMHAIRRRGSTQCTFAALSGVALAVGCFIGLVHVWIAACVIPATLLASRRADPDASLAQSIRTAIAALAGLALGGAIFFIVFGYDMISASRAVAAAQANVTRGPGAMPIGWQSLGIPLFALFAGGGMLASIAMLLCRSRSNAFADRLARSILLCTLCLMLATIGFTNLETPRLWIPFAALLVIAGGIRLQSMHSRPGRARLLALLVVLQVAAAALQWAVMDMRETELRLRIGSEGGARLFD